MYVHEKENFWLSSQSAKSCNACKNEKWGLRGQLFPSWVSSSDLHQCHLPRLFLCYALLKSHDLVLCIWLLREEESLKMGHFVQLANFQHPRTRLFWLGLFFDLTSKKSSVMRIWFWILDATFELKIGLNWGFFFWLACKLLFAKAKLPDSVANRKSFPFALTDAKIACPST